MRSSLLAGLLAVAATAQVVTGRQPARISQAIQSQATASVLFAVLDTQAQGFKPATIQEWVAQMQGQGFTRAGDFSSSGTWERTDSTGTLRASAFYLPEETSIWLFFFPSVRAPMPNPVLTALLRDAESTKLEDDGAVEVAFKTKSLKVASREGVRAEFVRLLGSTATLRRVVVNWHN